MSRVYNFENIKKKLEDGSSVCAKAMDRDFYMFKVKKTVFIGTSYKDDTRYPLDEFNERESIIECDGERFNYQLYMSDLGIIMKLVPYGMEEVSLGAFKGYEWVDATQKVANNEEDENEG